MSDKFFISLVMPCYNVEQFVAAALDSVLSQDFGDWELLAVDDCSTDGTVRVLEAASEDDFRIKVVKRDKNGGVSQARNDGLALAAGTHVAFIDPDDRFAPGLFSRLADMVAARNPDVITWGAIEEYSNQIGGVSYRRQVVLPYAECASGAEVRAKVLELEQATLFGYVWNKMYRREVILESKARFDEYAINEDFFFNVDLFHSVSSMIVLAEAYYFYSRRDIKKRSSLTAGPIEDYFRVSYARVEAMLSMYEEHGEDTEEVKGVLGAIYLRYALSALQRNCDPRAGVGFRDRHRWLDSFYERPLSIKLISCAAPRGRAACAFAALFKAGSRYALLTMARVVYVVNRYLPSLFSRLKQSR